MSKVERSSSAKCLSNGSVKSILRATTYEPAINPKRERMIPERPNSAIGRSVKASWSLKAMRSKKPQNILEAPKFCFSVFSRKID